MNNLSRNTPIAFVVGAAGFLGSNLVDKFLEKGIQVVAVDDLSVGTKENLTQATEEKKFYPFYQSATKDLPLELPRLDYAFFLVSPDISSFVYSESLANFLKICREYKPKVVLVSSIKLYDEHKGGLSTLRAGEKELADFSLKNKINARVVRLSGVYGPRMVFKSDEPIDDLIQAAIEGNLQKDPTPLDFTTRALFIDDATDLLIKAVMHGGSAQKIYDGALLNPIKITEIKQVLLDPLWHEDRGFTPTELPPWPTPNIEKTIKELNWEPKVSMVQGLKKTLAYFKERPLRTQKDTEDREEGTGGQVFTKENPFKELTKPDDIGQSLKEALESPKTKKINLKEPKKERQWGKKIYKSGSWILILAVVLFTFFYPVVFMAFEGVVANNHLQKTAFNISKGNFSQAEKEAMEARDASVKINELLASLDFVQKSDFLNQQLSGFKTGAKVLDKATSGAYHSVLGAKYLAKSLSVISGEEGDLKAMSENSTLEWTQAEKDISLAKSELNNKYIASLPFFLGSEAKVFQSKLQNSSELLEKGRVVASILDKVIPKDSKRSYLVVLEDNTQLRPGGGVIKAYALLNFNNSKFIEVKTDTTEKLSSLKSQKIEPPVELKTDLRMTNWYFADLGFDLDGPTNAKTIQWFYTKQTNEKINGVIVLDTTFIKDFLQVSGPITLPEGNLQIDTVTLNQALLAKDGKPLASLLKEITNRLLFVPNQDWAGLVQVFTKAVTEKHALIYISDPEVYSQLASAGWIGSVPKSGELEGKGERKDFLALSESNMGESRGAINKQVKLQTKIDDKGIVSSNLAIDFNNQAQEDQPVYKNRFKIYLPAGTKLVSATLDGVDIQKSLQTFSDYGRVGFSLLLEIKPQQKRNLVLEYQNQRALDLKEEKIKYSLMVFKQPGAENTPLEYKLTYPAGFKVAEGDFNQTIPQEIIFSKEISKDQILEAALSKN